MNNIMYLEVSESERYFNFGVDIDGEIEYFRINFFKNPYEYGIVIVNPDGGCDTFIAHYEEDINEKVYFEGFEYSIFIGSPHNEMFGITISCEREKH